MAAKTKFGCNAKKKMHKVKCRERESWLEGGGALCICLLRHLLALPLSLPLSPCSLFLCTAALALCRSSFPFLSLPLSAMSSRGALTSFADAAVPAVYAQQQTDTKHIIDASVEKAHAQRQ